MAYVVTRNGRHTGMYRTPNGERKSAGTYDCEAQAKSIAEQMEALEDPSGVTPAMKATITLELFVPYFLRVHEVAPVTKRNYASTIKTHIVPHLGNIRVAELTRQQVRQWLTELKEAGTSAQTTRRCRITLSAIMRLAIEDGYRDSNPATGVRTAKRSRKELTVLTVAQYKQLRKSLPTEGARLLAHLIVSSGMRFGEATALTARDFDNMQNNVLGIVKAVSDVGAEFHPNGKDRFILNPYPKNGQSRFITLDPLTIKLVKQYIANEGLQGDDLLFHIHRVTAGRAAFPATKSREALTPERIAALGTFIGPNGREYSHGTVNGYATGKCKCEPCKQAISIYSAGKRAEKRERARSGRVVQPRHYSVNSQGYIGRDSWNRVWRKAVKDAGIPFMPTSYQLRHTHASWLVDQGEDVKTVMTRLGHNDLSVTNLYVHRVADDSSAANIMGNLLGDDEEDVA